MLYACELLNAFLPLVLFLHALAGCRPNAVSLLLVHSAGLYLRVVFLPKAALVKIS